MNKKFQFRPFIKFLFVGGLNTVFGYLIYALFVYILTNPYISVVLATIVAVLFNFRTYGGLVFKSHDTSRLYRFFGVYISMMILQMIVLRILTSIGISNTYVAGAILTLPMSLLSFLLMRKFVFHQQQS